MKKLPLLLVVFAVVCAASVLGVVDVTWTFDQQQVDVLAYTCLNSDCTSVVPFSGQFLSGTPIQDGVATTNGQVGIRFPTSLATPYGYAVYAASDGYIAHAYSVTLFGSGSTSFAVDFEKIPVCSATVDEFVIINTAYENVPLMINTTAQLDATTHSAFEFTNVPVQYKPPQWKDTYFSADTNVTLEIFNATGARIEQFTNEYSARLDNPIYASENQFVSFSWTPSKAGTYTARITSTVTDTQCATAVPQSATSNQFPVLRALPRNMCYTILNDLMIYPQNPQATEPITVTFSKISNWANDYPPNDPNYVLTPVPTLISFEVLNSTGMLVGSGSTPVQANPNAVDPVFYSFFWTPANEGAYRIRVNAIGTGAICDSLETNLGEEELLNIYVDPQPRYDVNFHIAEAISGSPLSAVRVTLNGSVQQTDGQGQTSFVDLTPGSYRYTLERAGYATVNYTVEVSDYDVELFLTMHRNNRAPVISGLPDIYMTSGTQTSIDLDDYVQDSNNADEDLTWTSWGGQTVQVLIDPYTHIATFTAPAGFVGNETIGFRVTDPGNLWAQDTLVVFVENSNEAPVISGLPDVVLDEDTAAFDAFNLEDYVSDHETSQLTFFIVGNTNPSVGVSIDSYHNIDIQPDVNYFGQSIVTVQVSDGQRMATDSFVVTVNSINDLPVIFNPGTVYVQEGQTVSVDLSVYEFDVEDSGSQLQWSGSVVDTSIITPFISGKTLSITGNAAGTDTLMLRLTDSDGGFAERAMTVVVEAAPIPQCRDSIDNDGDGFIDYPNDLGCTSPEDNDESDDPVVYYPACRDGLDNDDDGFIDYPNDPQCISYDDDSESGLLVISRVEAQKQSLNGSLYSFGSIPQGATISNVDPGDTIFIDVDVMNLFETVSGIALQNVVVTGTINGLPGGASIHDSESYGTIPAGATAEQTLTFATPAYAGHGLYVITLTATGTDSAYGETHQDTYTFILHLGTSSSTARSERESDVYSLFVSNIRIPEEFHLLPGDLMRASITFENDGNKDLENVKVSIVVPELGIRDSVGPFDLNDGEQRTENVVLPLPDDLESGIYYARVTITSAKSASKRVIYREFEVGGGLI